MPLATLSSAALAHQSIEASSVVVLLVSETMMEQCLAMEIPITARHSMHSRNTGAGPASSQDATMAARHRLAAASQTTISSQSVAAARKVPVEPGQQDRPHGTQRLLVGRGSWEILWAAVKVPKTSSSATAKHWFALWVEAPPAIDRRQGHLGGDFDLHPCLNGWILRMLSLSDQPIRVHRSHDRSYRVVDPGQPCSLRAYDTISVGSFGDPNQSATFRVIPARFVSTATRHPTHSDAENASSSSSLVTFCSHPTNAGHEEHHHADLKQNGMEVCCGSSAALLPYGVAPADGHTTSAVGSRRRLQITVSDIIPFIMCDVAENMKLMQRQLSDATATGTAYIKSQDTPPVVSSQKSQQQRCSSASYPRDEAAGESGAVTAAAAIVLAGKSTLQLRGGNEPARAASIQSHVSDSDTVDSYDRPVASRVRPREDDETPESQCVRSDQLVVPATAASGGGAHRPSTGATSVDAVEASPIPRNVTVNCDSNVVVARSSTRDSSSAGPAHHASHNAAQRQGAAESFQESFDDRWDEHLAALEARSAEAYHTMQQHKFAVPHPQLLLESGASHSSLGKADSFLLTRAPMLGSGVGTTASHTIPQYQQESQTVCFGLMDDD